MTVQHSIAQLVQYNFWSWFLLLSLCILPIRMWTCMILLRANMSQSLLQNNAYYFCHFFACCSFPRAIGNKGDVFLSYGQGCLPLTYHTGKCQRQQGWRLMRWVKLGISSLSQNIRFTPKGACLCQLLRLSGNPCLDVTGQCAKTSQQMEDAPTWIHA